MNFTISDIIMTVKDRTNHTLEDTPTLFSNRKGPKGQIARACLISPPSTPDETLITEFGLIFQVCVIIHVRQIIKEDLKPHSIGRRF